MLLRGESMIISILGLVIFGVVIGSLAANVPVIWSGFVPVFALGTGLAAFGLLLRLRGFSPHLSALLFVVGLYPVFGSMMSITTKLAFPLQRPLIDERLFAIDRALGYDWDRAVEWMASSPELSKILAVIYLSSFAQILALVIWLGLTRRGAVLHQFLLTAMLATLMTTLFWFIWPSFGPAAYIDLPAETLAASGLVVTPEYGAVLMALAATGFEQIDAHLALGAIAFPSYHIVMAVMVVWFARGTWLFWPALALNLPMIPATLTHGGHHLIDLPGGVVAFALAALLADRLMQSPAADPAPALHLRA